MQVYLQSHKDLYQESLVKPLAEWMFDPTVQLKLWKDLRGLADSGHYWNALQPAVLSEKVCMTPQTGNQSLHSMYGLSGFFGRGVTNVDDLLGVGNKSFQD